MVTVRMCGLGGLFTTEYSWLEDGETPPPQKNPNPTDVRSRLINTPISLFSLFSTQSKAKHSHPAQASNALPHPNTGATEHTHTSMPTVLRTRHFNFSSLAIRNYARSK